MVEVKGSVEGGVYKGELLVTEAPAETRDDAKSESERNRKREPVSDTRVVRRGLAGGRDREEARLLVCQRKKVSNEKERR